MKETRTKGDFFFEVLGKWFRRQHRMRSCIPEIRMTIGWAVLEVGSDYSTEWGAVYQKSPMNDYRGVSEVVLYTCNYQNTC